MNEENILKDKSKATFYHFFGSLLLILIAAYLIFSIWYPSPFFKLYQVNQVFLLLIFIDVILGPLCTFIVYKKGKKTLKMDIAVIVLLQLIAFGFGMWNIAQARPAWLVLNESIVYAVSPNMLIDETGNKKVPSIVQQNWGKPKLVLVKNDVPQVNKDEPIIYQFNDFTANTPDILKERKLSLDNIKKYNENLHQDVISNYPTVTGYLPVLTEANMNVPAMLIDDDGEVVTILHDKYYEENNSK